MTKPFFAKEEILALITPWISVDPKSGCWNWTRALANGYGSLWIKTRFYKTHRLIAAVFHGLDITDTSIFVCHRCDNPKCCNPDHLFLGDQTINMMDARMKNRFPTGTDHWHSRITDEDVRSIFELYNRGEETDALAKKFSVHRGYIEALLNKKYRRQASNGLMRNRRGRTQKRKVKCIDTKQVFESASAAAKALDLYPENILHVCHDRIKTTGGYRFEFCD
jgi:hypothetical protein